MLLAFLDLKFPVVCMRCDLGCTAGMADLIAQAGQRLTQLSNLKLQCLQIGLAVVCLRLVLGLEVLNLSLRLLLLSGGLHNLLPGSFEGLQGKEVTNWSVLCQPIGIDPICWGLSLEWSCWDFLESVQNIVFGLMSLWSITEHGKAREVL